jgi:fructose-specific phosphotransferase system IIC component
MSVTPLLTRALRYGGLVAALVAVGAAAIGLAVAGAPGLTGGLVGAAMSFVYLGLTAVSMLVGGRAARGDGTSPVFFGVVIAFWLLKLIVFVIAAVWLRGQDWLDPAVFAGTVIVAVLGSLIADVVAFVRARIPYVSDVELPGQGTGKS